MITKARPFITAELCTSCCLGESWLQQQKCSHVTSPPICIPFIYHLPCRVVKQGWMEIWAWGGKSSLEMVQSCWPWSEKDLDLLSWWRQVCYLMSLALLPKGDLHFGSRQKLNTPISAFGRTEHQSCIGGWKIPQPFSSLADGVVFESQLSFQGVRSLVFGKPIRNHSKTGRVMECSKICHHFSSSLPEGGPNPELSAKAKLPSVSLFGSGKNKKLYWA